MTNDAVTAFILGVPQAGGGLLIQPALFVFSSIGVFSITWGALVRARRPPLRCFRRMRGGIDEPALRSFDAVTETESLTRRKRSCTLRSPLPTHS